MLEKIVLWEKDLFLFLHSPHSPIGDAFMYMISAVWPWVLVIVVLVFFLFYKKPAKEAILFILVAVLLMVITDQLSSHLIKPLCARLRPTYHPLTKDLVQPVYGYLASGYSFVSGHATNFLAIATFTSLTFRNRWYSFIVFALALTVAYSRIYLGVHFVSDVVCGALLGFCVAWGVSTVYQKLRRVLFFKGKKVTTQQLYAPTIHLFSIFLVTFAGMLLTYGVQLARIIKHLPPLQP